MENIININEYKTKKPLSDDDIKSLFLGLVNLIKNNAIETMDKKVKQEFKENLIKLNNAKMEIKIQNEIILELKRENDSLTSKMKLLLTKIENLTKTKNSL